MRFSYLLIGALLGLASCKKESSTPGPRLIDIPYEHPATGLSSMPRLFANDSVLYMSWTEEVADTAYLKYAYTQDDRWSSPVTLAKGTDWFVNWADFPQIAVSQGNLLATYLKKSDTATFAYDIRYVLRRRDGKEIRGKLHSDSTMTEHGFVSVVPINDGGFFLSWLDGRHTAGGHGHDHQGAMTLRGGYLDVDGNITDSELDARVCDCCTTSATSLPEGVLVAYRDRSEEEVRDISVVRNINGNWTESMNVHDDNWIIPGCPVNGPSVVSNDDQVALGWFTAADDRARVMFSLSHDRGNSFEPPLRLDNGNATGRVSICSLGDAGYGALWMEPSGDTEVLKLKQLDKQGSVIAELQVTGISAERASGFPQIARLGDQLYIAWTEILDSGNRILMARLEI